MLHAVNVYIVFVGRGEMNNIILMQIFTYSYRNVMGTCNALLNNILSVRHRAFVFTMLLVCICRVLIEKKGFRTAIVTVSIMMMPKEVMAGDIRSSARNNK